LIASLADSPYDHERVQLSANVSLERLLGHARQRLWDQQVRMGLFPEWDIYISDTDRDFCLRIALSRPGIERVGEQAPRTEPFLSIAAPFSLCVLLAIGHVSWNIADAALFLDYDRHPNVYDTTVYTLLNLLKV
jgi:UDP-MurNAc hydroxylase